jgi:hypothetical protein
MSAMSAMSPDPLLRFRPEFPILGKTRGQPALVN